MTVCRSRRPQSQEHDWAESTLQWSNIRDFRAWKETFSFEHIRNFAEGLQCLVWFKRSTDLPATIALLE